MTSPKRMSLQDDQEMQTAPKKPDGNNIIPGPNGATYVARQDWKRGFFGGLPKCTSVSAAFGGKVSHGPGPSRP